MLWGCVAAGGPGALHRVDGVMKKDDYLKVLQHILKLSARQLRLGHSWVFQQDNNPKHTSKLIVEEIKQVFGEAFKES